jgi:hypothetical protein
MSIKAMQDEFETFDRFLASTLVLASSEVLLLYPKQQLCHQTSPTTQKLTLSEHATHE